MPEQVKFYSVYEWSGGDQGMTSLLRQHGMTAVQSPSEADLLVFNGGADIGTEMYGEDPAMDGIPKIRSVRDREEQELYEKYKGSKFFLGICRGAQLLNVLNGGTLWQHVDSHGRDHDMVDLLTGAMYRVTSTHHQMMRPAKAGQVIGIASESHVKISQGETHQCKPHEGDWEDAEVVWYKDSKTLCVQGHPEYVPGTPFAEYVLDLVRAFMNSKKDVA